jgi:hypothetical protein
LSVAYTNNNGLAKGARFDSGERSLVTVASGSTPGIDRIGRQAGQLRPVGTVQ